LAFFDHRTGKIMPNCELLDDATEQEWRKWIFSIQFRGQ
jgi:hypothetical protein